MSKLTRSTKILRVAMRYRLDTFLVTNGNNTPLKPLLNAFKRLPEPTKPRGERLRLALEDLGPVFIKFGQILSTRPDLVPADISAELEKLQDRVPPFDGDQFTAIVEEALGKPVEELFQSFDRTPLASASVAQVHAAVLESGEQVIVKAIRPDIEDVIGADTDLMLSVARKIEKYVPALRRLHPVEIVEGYKSTIFDELNLQREAANASSMKNNFEHSDLIYVPTVHWPLTNEKVMVAERVFGIPVTNIEELKAKNTDFKALAECGVEIFFTQVFEHNFFHADMHPGNIFVDASNPKKPQYQALDCAIMGALTEAEQYYLARNLIAVFRRDYRQVAELHIESGWVGEGTSVHDFASAIRTVCEPIFQRPFSEISFGQILVSLFKTAQRYDMEVQPSMVLLQKTLLNVEGLGRQLYPDLDLWETAHPFLEKWITGRYRPNALMEQLKRHGPGWLEQFPQLPQMIFQSLENLQRLEQPSRQPRRKQVQQVVKKSPNRLIGITAVAAAVGLTYPHWTNPEPANLILGVVGLYLMLRPR